MNSVTVLAYYGLSVSTGINQRTNAQWNNSITYLYNLGIRRDGAELRSRDGIYDDLLRHQVELSFDLEQMFFQSCAAWHCARSVLDFGCGNGYYARKLAGKYPDKKFVCVERDSALAARASSWTRLFDIRVVNGTFTDLPDDSIFDFVVARHSISYLQNRPEFMKWVSQHTTTEAGVLTIDADDAQFFVNPPMPQLEAGNEQFKERVRAKGGERELQSRLDDEWQQVGFARLRTYPIVVHSDIVERRDRMHMFMTSVAEWDHGSPLPDLLYKELQSWIMNPSSYLQYGFFGSIFVKVGK